MRVAIYARHSSDKQSKSTRDQIARCKAWCAQKNYMVSDVFFDEAISGANVQNRPGIRNLIQALLLNNFDKIVCEDLSRLSRDQEDIAAFYKKLLFLDIPLETISDGEINELHIGLKGTMNALYLKDLADKTKRGMIAAVLNGSVPGGKTYGYDLVREFKNDEPVRGLRKINQHEAEIIRTIFNDYVDGNTLSQICTRLNRMAIPSPKDKKWNKTTLIGTVERKTGLLRQTLYKGVVTFNKMAYKKHPDTGNRLSIIRPENEWIRVPLPELTIIEEPLFDKVQGMIEARSSINKELKNQRAVMKQDERLEENRKAVKQHRSRQIKQRRYQLQLISRKLHCADHNKSIISIRSGVYICPVKNCRNRNLHRAPLVELTRQSMKTLNVTKLKQYLKSLEQEKREYEKQQILLHRNLDLKRTEIRSILDQFSKAKIRTETRRYLDEKEQECQRFIYEINQLQKDIDARKVLTDKELKEIISRFQTLLLLNEIEPEDEYVLEQLNSFILQANLSSVWDDHALEYQTSITIDFDFKKVLKISKP